MALTGSEFIGKAQVDRVLRVSTRHMPDYTQDLSIWHWGQTDAMGLAWVFAPSPTPADAYPNA